MPYLFTDFYHPFNRATYVRVTRSVSATIIKPAIILVRKRGCVDVVVIVAGFVMIFELCVRNTGESEHLFDEAAPALREVRFLYTLRDIV